MSEVYFTVHGLCSPNLTLSDQVEATVCVLLGPDRCREGTCNSTVRVRGFPVLTSGLTSPITGECQDYQG